MNNLKNTIIEENLPILRRKSFDTLKKFVKNKICDTLRAFPDHLHLEKISLKESEEAINTHFQKIHTIIDAIDYHITKRLVNHENQVFLIAKDEIQEMKEQTKKIIQNLNELIAQKNTQVEIWKLSNELDYFKFQTYKLFNENKKLSQQIVTFKRSEKQLRLQLQTNFLIMQKLKKKYYKQNLIKEKLISMIRQKIQNNKAKDITLEKINEILKIQKTRSKEKVKTQPIAINDQKLNTFFLSKRQSHHAQDNNKDCKEAQKQKQKMQTSKFSFQSSLKQKRQDIVHDLPSAKLINVQSQLQNNNIKHFSNFVFKKIDETIQQDYCKKPNQMIKQFRNTSYIQLSKQIPEKKLDLSKNGFFVRSYNQVNNKLSTNNQGSSKFMMKRQSRNMRYITNTSNKSKLLSQSTLVRSSINKSSIK